MDIAALTQAPRDITLAGLPYKARPLKAREWGALHQWLKDHAEDPFTQAVRQVARTKSAGAPITQEQEDYLLSEARREAKSWPPRASSSAWFELLGDTEGGDVQFLLAVLRTGLPGMTEDEAREIGEKLDGGESSALMLLSMGLDPSPKAKGATSSTTRKRRPDPTRTTGRKLSTG